MTRLEDRVRIAGLELPNRLYRAPLLECAGNGPDAVETLVSELEPAAESGVGLVFQGATIVTAAGGCAAPGMTRVHDPAFVARLSRLTDAVHDHGGRIFVQLEHGGLRSMETWHAGYRSANPGLRQPAVSRPPALLRALDRLGFLHYDPHVLSTDEVYDLAADFGRSAGYAVDAGYDGVHLAGANMGIIQQFLSPYYNDRDDEFGGDLAGRLRFLELLHDEIRARVGEDVPVVTKVPAETGAPPFVRRRITREEGVEMARRLADAGFDALVPVECSPFWDASIVRGRFPARAWRASKFRAGYRAAFGGRVRAAAVGAATWASTLVNRFEPAWNESFCRRVREVVDVPVLAEGGIRTREGMDRLLDSGAADMVGMGRPFYAEPKLGARLLEPDDDGVAAVCENCNNCTVPQVTGARGVCRTPSVLREKGELEREDAYER